MVRRILEANPYREQGVRSAFGLMRKGEKHGAERTERACAHALSFGGKSCKPIKRMLELKLERRLCPTRARRKYRLPCTRTCADLAIFTD